MGQGRHTLRSINDPVYPMSACESVFSFSISAVHESIPMNGDGVCGW